MSVVCDICHIFVNSAQQTLLCFCKSGVSHGRTRYVKVSAAAYLFKYELDVYLSVGTGGYVYRVAYEHQSKRRVYVSYGK